MTVQLGDHTSPSDPLRGEEALAELHDAYPASLAEGKRLVTKVDRGVELIEAFSVVPILAPVS